MNRALAALAALYLTAHVLPALAETKEEKAEAEADAEAAAKQREAAKEAAAKAPPPAIPGAVSGSEVIPADKAASEMSPNDALFDAIARGDAVAARDALSRGAQLDAKNVLGQTPVDAAIDLNRNDITFLLLSMRGASPSRAAVSKVAAAPLGPVVRHGRLPATAARHVVAPPAPVYADRGTPNPSAGFTGF